MIKPKDSSNSCIRDYKLFVNEEYKGRTGEIAERANSIRILIIDRILGEHGSLRSDSPPYL